jgi:hypothetical protein
MNGREQLEAELQAAAMKLAAFDRATQEFSKLADVTTGAVVRFTKKFARNGAGYTYAAIYVHGAWYLTGNSTRSRPTRMSVDRFAMWLAGAPGYEAGYRVEDLEILSTGHKPDVSRPPAAESIFGAQTMTESLRQEVIAGQQRDLAEHGYGDGHDGQEWPEPS